MASRRSFLLNSAVPWLLQTHTCFGFAGPQAASVLPSAPTTRPDVAKIDHARILAAASRALQRPLAEDNIEGEAFLQFTLDLPALAAACIVDREASASYLLKARALLSAWLVSATTRLSPKPSLHKYNLLAERSSLAEVAQAIPFLDLPGDEFAAALAWFRQALDWLNQDRTALLARDSRDHNASAWLLQASAYASLLADETVLAEQRHRFQRSILRAQINADGLFRNDLAGSDPFRLSLYNLDLLAGSAMLLSTRFESIWNYELQDGPGLRVAIARYAAFIAAPSTWPYPADTTHFADLPGRRPALLFAGRAYSNANYVALWSTLNPDPTASAILRSFPIRQPILWVTKRPMG